MSGLIAGKLYLFNVASTDEAGNATTNNNGGALFSFIAPTVAKVLLVDDYTDLLFEGHRSRLHHAAHATRHQLRCLEHQRQRLAQLEQPAALSLRDLALAGIHGHLDVAGTKRPCDYIANGGSLLVASMEVLSRLKKVASTPPSRAASRAILRGGQRPGDVPDVIGAANDPIGNGIDLGLDYTPYVDFFKDLIGIPGDISDSFTPEANATPIFFDSFGETIGMKWPRTGVDALGRVVFLSFPLDARAGCRSRPTCSATSWNSSCPALMAAPPRVGSIPIPVPSQVVIEVNDADVAGSGTLNVSYSSTTQTSPPTLAPLETTRARHASCVRSPRRQPTLPPPVNSPRRTATPSPSITPTPPPPAQNRPPPPLIPSCPTSPASAVVDYEAVTTFRGRVPSPAIPSCNTVVSQFLDQSASDLLLTTDHEITQAACNPTRRVLFPKSAVAILRATKRRE